jgi:hypothetical protein
MTKNKKKQIPFPLFTRSPKKKKNTIGGKIQNQPKGKEKKRKKKSIIKRKAQTIKKK